MEIAVLTIIAVLLSVPLFSQENKNSELYKALKKNDSLLFEVRCNSRKNLQFEKPVSGKVVPYHDRTGSRNAWQAGCAG